MTGSCPANLPFDYDPDEPEVRIYFEASPAEKQTRDYPGCDAIVEMDKVVRVDSGAELDMERFPDWVMEELETVVWDYLEETSAGPE